MSVCVGGRGRTGVEKEGLEWVSMNGSRLARSASDGVQDPVGVETHDVGSEGESDQQVDS